jgi:hypothetical protein
VIPRELLPLLFRRTLALWLLVRLLLGMAGAIVGLWLLPSAGLSARVAVLVALVVLLDLRRRGERILWANLGAGLPVITVAALVVGLIAEVALGLTVSVLRGGAG